MGKNEFMLPAMGEGIIEATITRWFVKEGDEVQEDDPLLEVATDKVDSEVPSPFSGTISRIIYHEGEIPKIGEVLALIQDANDTEEPIESIEGPKGVLIREQPKKPTKDVIEDIKIHKSTSSHKNQKLLSPFVRFLAKDRGISFDELIQIKGSGLKERITKDDLNSYILDGRPFKDTGTFESAYDTLPSEQSEPTRQEDYIPGEGEELIEMSRTRRLIAEHMVRSKRTSPHVTSMVEIDVTPVVQWRNLNKQNFLKKHGIKLTYTPLIVEATSRALKDFPDINISTTGNYIIKKRDINIGVATALPDGNLIVPVIRETDKRSFVNIAKELSDMAQRAREGKLIPLEIKGGTFTVTNMGQYENISGTPIINQPEAAILAVGAIKKKPGVVILKGEETIGIRDILILSLTYDHRIVDGALGGSFVKRIGEYFTTNLPDF